MKNLRWNKIMNLIYIQFHNAILSDLLTIRAMSTIMWKNMCFSEAYHQIIFVNFPHSNLMALSGDT